MDSTWLDTSLSLDLNIIPSTTIDDTPPAEVLVQEFHRISYENKKLTETLSAMRANYNDLQSQLMGFISKNSCEKDFIRVNKRKVEGEYYSNVIKCDGNRNIECSSSEEESYKRPMQSQKPKFSRVLIPTDVSDASLVVKDGYNWRKYGQKVTRDNPSPRAYYKCSFAPNCPVKKKVQRSVEDPTLLVATYEGHHNHAYSSPTVLSLGLTPVSTSLQSSGQQIESPVSQQFSVQEMVSSLTRDPTFTTALASAISGRVLCLDWNNLSLNRE